VLTDFEGAMILSGTASGALAEPTMRSGGAPIIIEKRWTAICGGSDESDTVNSKVKGCFAAAVGVPSIFPSDETAKPGGSWPPETRQLKGAKPPSDLICAE